MTRVVGLNELMIGESKTKSLNELFDARSF